MAALTALTRLDLRSYNDPSVPPGCEELACLRHMSLQHVAVPLFQVLVAETDSEGQVPIKQVEGEGAASPSGSRASVD